MPLLAVAAINLPTAALLSLDSLKALEASNLTPREKIESLLNQYVLITASKTDWHLQVWARELLNPSPFIGQIFTQKAWPKMQVLLQIFADYLQLKKNDPRLYSYFLSAMAPFLLTFLAHNNAIGQYVPQICTQQELQKNIKTFVFAGLDAVREKQ